MLLESSRSTPFDLIDPKSELSIEFGAPVQIVVAVDSQHTVYGQQTCQAIAASHMDAPQAYRLRVSQRYGESDKLIKGSRSPIAKGRWVQRREVRGVLDSRLKIL